MTRIYIDDSVHERGKFIISGVVTTEKDVDTKITEILIENGLNKKTDEFKSRLCSPSNPAMIKVRKQLNHLIRKDCKIGLIILPITHREKIGIETLKGLKKIIDSKHRAIKAFQKVCVYLQSPLNIKFGIYSRKYKSKIFIFS